MSIIDRVSKTFSETGQKTKDLAEIAKLNGKISNNERRIKQIYRDLGELYCTLHAEDAEEEFVEMVASANELAAQNQEWDAQIRELKGMVKCPECGKFIEKDAQVCMYCGYQVIPEPAPNPEPDPSGDPVRTPPRGAAASPMAAPGGICPICGEKLEDDVLFCPNCGTRVQLTLQQTGGENPEKTFVCRCGTVLDPDALFCPNCGTRRADLEAECGEETPESEEPEEPETPETFGEEPASEENEEQREEPEDAALEETGRGPEESPVPEEKKTGNPDEEE